ncbi:MAG TPA: serine protease [Burkholderiales bacterium]|nr:serine protease [Burkholderiales bacterium]
MQPQILVHSVRRLLGQDGAGGLESVGAESVPTLQRVDQIYEQARQKMQTGDTRSVHARLAEAALEEGRKGLRKVLEKPDAPQLSEAERTGLEAIILLTGRPSFLVQNDAVTVEQRGDQWAGHIARESARITEVLRRVGRVNVPGYGAGYVGTAFMVAEDLAMTNRHVAMAFAARAGSSWKVGGGFTPSVDFKCEQGSDASMSFEVKGIPVIHPDPQVDLAILKLAKKSKDRRSLPAPLKVSKTPAAVAQKRQVYVVGYPAFDPRNDASAIGRIFGQALMVKRFAPGEVMSPPAGAKKHFTHDCSTLGGNSGSCVIDFGNHVVFGLHYGGAYLEENRAVALAKLQKDAQLKGKGIVFA